MSRVQVLELVHQEGAASRPGLLTGIRLSDEDLNGPVDLLVKIKGAGLRESGTISIETVANSCCVRKDPLRHRRFHQLQPNSRQGLEVGGQHVGVRPPPYVKRRLDEPAGIHLVQDPEPARASEFVADVVGEAVDRADVRHMASEPLRGAAPHLIRRLDVERQGSHRFGRRPGVEHQVPQPLGQHPRLSGTSGCDHRAGPAP